MKSALFLILGLIFLSVEYTQAQFWRWNYYRPYYPYYYRPYYWRPWYRPYYGRFGRDLQMQSNESIRSVLKTGNDTKIALCDLRLNESTIYCHSPLGPLECSVKNNLNLIVPKLEFFGIGVNKHLNQTEKIAESRFALYPKLFNLKGNETWLSNSIKIDNKEKKLRLFFSNLTVTVNDGVQVTDWQCFKKLVKILDWSEQHKKNITLTDQKKKNIVGDLLVIQ